MHLFTSQETIGKSIKEFICNNGYTITSFSRLVNLSKFSLNQIIEGIITNPDIYHEYIKKITEALSLPYDYFLKCRPEKLEKFQWFVAFFGFRSDLRSKIAQELLDDLDELLIVAVFYIK